MYATCPRTDKPRCLIFDQGEELTRRDGTRFWQLSCRYLDFNGTRLCNISTKLVIESFKGTKAINTLEVFPLEFHAHPSSVKSRLVRRGKTFGSLIGTHHRHYKGAAFTKDKDGNLIKFTTNERIMIDALFFRKMQPSYFKKQAQDEDWSSFCSAVGLEESSNQSQSRPVLPASEALTDQEYLICCPTVPGFCFDKKTWGKEAQLTRDPS